jgi:hypothetical protein
LDAETELTNASSIEGTIVYNYRLVNYLVNQVDVAVVRGLQPQIARDACGTPSTRNLLDQSVSLRYAHNDKRGAPITFVDVTKSDCDWVSMLPSK